VGLGLLAGLIGYVKVGSIVDTLRAGHLGWVAIAAALVVPNVLLDAWVWNRILNAAGMMYSSDRIVRAVLAGYAAGFFTPARLGEFAGRAFALPSSDGWTVSVTVLAQRVADMTVALTAGWIALVALRTGGPVFASGATDGSVRLISGIPLLESEPAWVDVALIALGLSVTLAFGAMIVRPSAVDRLARRRCPHLNGLHDRTQVLSTLRASDRGWVVAGSAGRYVIYGAQLAFLVRAFEATAPVALLSAGVAVTYFLKHLIPSLTLFDIGIREGAAVFAFGLIGVSPSAALNASLAIFALNVALPAAVGVPFLSAFSGSHPGETASVDPSEQALTTPIRSSGDAQDTVRRNSEMRPQRLDSPTS